SGRIVHGVNRKPLAMERRALILIRCNESKPQGTAPYAAANTVDIVDDYHSTTAADPYRCMEDLDSKHVADWVAAQNKSTVAELNALPMREYFKERITNLWDYPKTSIPRKEGGRYFYLKNSGLQKQAPLYVRARLDAAPALVLDPNMLSPDGSL